MTNTKELQISLISKEAAESNQALLDNLNEQVADAKNSKAGLALKELVDGMTPLPESIADVTAEQLDQVRADKNTLVKARTSVSGDAKTARDLQTGINKAIRSYELGILEIAGEEETKRKDFIKKVEAHHLQKERMKSLPEYRQRFEDAGIPANLTANLIFVKLDKIITPESKDIILEEVDKFILSLDTTERESFFNECFSEKLNADKVAADKKAEADRVAEEQAQEAQKEAEAKAERVKVQKEAEARAAQLPERREKLDAIGDAVQVSDEVLNGMDDVQYQTYYNGRVADKNAADKKALEGKEAADKDAREAKEAADKKIVKDTRLSQVQSEISAITDLGQLEKYGETTTQYEEEINIFKARKEVLEGEAKAKNEAEMKRAADEKYQTWLKEEFEEGFEIRETDNGVEIWRLVATYKAE